NQVLTAAHCLCGSQTGTVTFADNTGNVTPGARTWPILGVAFPSNARVCGSEWADWTEDDPAFHQPFHVALVTIGPDATGLPPITPSPMFLGDAGTGIATLSLLNNVWAVGYGNNFPAPWNPEGDRCAGCSIRRSGPIGQVFYGDDPCSYAGPIPLEQDCYESPLWYARSISEGNFSEPAQGDSGGGLFFNIELTCTNSNQGTMTPGVLGGVLSGWHSAEDTRARWAPLGHS